MTPQRLSRALTRRARPASGEISAAVLPSTARASRSSRAATVAASSSVRAVMTERPARPSAMGSISAEAVSARRASICCIQSAVSPGGRRASLISRRRQRVAPLGVTGGQSITPARETPARASNRLRVYWGCGSPTSVHADSARSASSPGKTTQPRGAPAITRSRSADDGAEPVEPAAITGRVGGWGAPLFGQAAQQADAALGDVHQAKLAQPRRPGLHRDVEEVRRLLPVAGEVALHQTLDLSGRIDLLDLAAVEEGGQGVGEGQNLGGIDAPAERALMLGDEARQLEPSSPGRDRRGQVDRHVARLERRLALVEIADHPDLRQDQRPRR